jgi:hypothetical protein
MQSTHHIDPNNALDVALLETYIGGVGRPTSPFFPPELP